MACELQLVSIMRNIIGTMVLAILLGACGAHAHVGPVHAGGGVGHASAMHVKG